MASVNRREFLSLLAAGVGAATAGALPRPSRAAADTRPPNVVLIFTDDQGYQDVGCFGSPKIKTPHLDRMAQQGMKFTSFYSAAPVCSASRAALLTGCYPARVGITGVLFPNSNNGISDKELTVAELLKGRGYATACIGKWHLGHLEPFLPTRHGFDRYYGIPYSNDMTIDPQSARFADNCAFRDGQTAEQARTKGVKNLVPLMENEQIIEYPVDQSTLTRRYTEQAVKFIRENKDRPFFLYLPHTMPHIPLAVSEALKGKSARGLYGDVIEEIDWSVGQILQVLDEVKLDRNTLVVFTSDNGPWLSMKANGGCALPLRDGKFSTWEGGMREPCIMRWTGTIPGGRVCDEVAGTIDVLPTLAGLAGAKLPDDRVIDGRDISPLMTAKDGAVSPHEHYFYWRGGALEAVRSGKWKLHLGGQNKKAKDKDSKPLAPAGQLFDLQADIGEKTDLAARHPDVAERLAGAIRAAREEMRKNARPCGRADRPKGRK